ncbi:hypothetical protein B0H19DRAFT_1076648 [Mycena capillaripes]|nr:hypothetical protein B0H19DRAFT_1076648 [Mycena capillaripes]
MSGGDKTRRSARTRAPAPRGPTSTTIPLPAPSVRQRAARAPEPQPDVEVITSDEGTAVTIDNNDPSPSPCLRPPSAVVMLHPPMDVDESVSALVIKIPRPAKAPASRPSARAADLFNEDVAVVPRPKPRPKAAGSSSRAAPAAPKSAPAPARRVAEPVRLTHPPLDLASVVLPSWASTGVSFDFPVQHLEPEVDRYYNDPHLTAAAIAQIHKSNRGKSHPRLASCTKIQFVEDCWPLSQGYAFMKRMGGESPAALTKSFASLLQESSAFLFQNPEIAPLPDLPSSDEDLRWIDKDDPEPVYVAYAPKPGPVLDFSNIPADQLRSSMEAHTAMYTSFMLAKMEKVGRVRKAFDAEHAAWSVHNTKFCARLPRVHAWASKLIGEHNRKRLELIYLYTCQLNSVGDYILHLLTLDFGPPDPMLEILSTSSVPACPARSHGLSPPPSVAGTKRDHSVLEIDSGAVDMNTDSGSDASSDNRPLAPTIPTPEKGMGKANPASGPVEETLLDGKCDDAPVRDREYEFLLPPVNEDGSRAPPSHGWPWCSDRPRLVDGLQKWFVTGQSLPERSFFVRGSGSAFAFRRETSRPPACNHCRADGATCTASTNEFPWEVTAQPGYGVFIVENLCETSTVVVGENFVAALVDAIRQFIRDTDPPSDLQEGNAVFGGNAPESEEDAGAPAANFDVSMEEVAREAPSPELAPVCNPLWFPNLTPLKRSAVEARKAQNGGYPDSCNKSGVSKAQWFRKTGFGKLGLSAGQNPSAPSPPASSSNGPSGALLCTPIPYSLRDSNEEPATVPPSSIRGASVPPVASISERDSPRSTPSLRPPRSSPSLRSRGRTPATSSSLARALSAVPRSPPRPAPIERIGESTEEHSGGGKDAMDVQSG